MEIDIHLSLQVTIICSKHIFQDYNTFICDVIFKLIPIVGCLFKSEEGLISFDNPFNKVRGVVIEDDEGFSTAVIFQVDLFTRLYSITRRGSDANWSGVTVVEVKNNVCCFSVVEN